MTLEKDFHAICTEAQAAEPATVSLYVGIPFYGGPEEGGWWGSDTHLVASQSFPSIKAAHNARCKVLALAEERNRAAKRAYGDQCLRESDWLDARGLDDGALPEVAGEDVYFVAVEAYAGSLEERGSRHYE